MECRVNIMCAVTKVTYLNDYIKSSESYKIVLALWLQILNITKDSSLAPVGSLEKIGNNKTKNAVLRISLSLFRIIG